MSLQQARDIFKSYPMSNGLPERIEVATIVSTMKYKKLIQFVFIEYKDIGRGRASSEPSVEKKADMARLLNRLANFSQNLKSFYCRQGKIRWAK